MPHPKNQMETKSYWLKCWRETAMGHTTEVWRFSLEDPHTGKRLGFASLEALFIYVKAVLADEEKEV